MSTQRVCRVFDNRLCSYVHFLSSGDAAPQKVHPPDEQLITLVILVMYSSTDY